MARKKKHDKPLTIDMDFSATLERFSNVAPSEIENERVRLVEREDSAHPLLIYATPKGINVDPAWRDSTLWARQDQMADMFGVNVPSISRHLKNIYDEGELDPNATLSKIERVATEGGRTVKRQIETYNLNAIISVGYRVGSKQGTMFRIWATDRLVQIVTKGFYVDKERLMNEGEPDALAEFKETARQIRTSIRNSYREVLKPCTLCSDYDGSPEVVRDFFMGMENKLLWAASSKTAPQLILERADAEATDMGLTYYAGCIASAKRLRPKPERSQAKGSRRKQVQRSHLRDDKVRVQQVW